MENRETQKPYIAKELIFKALVSTVIFMNELIWGRSWLLSKYIYII
jgi:hypothetical protein